MWFERILLLKIGNLQLQFLKKQVNFPMREMSCIKNNCLFFRVMLLLPTPSCLPHIKCLYSPRRDLCSGAKLFLTGSNSPGAQTLLGYGQLPDGLVQTSQPSSKLSSQWLPERPWGLYQEGEVRFSEPSSLQIPAQFGPGALQLGLSLSGKMALRRVCSPGLGRACL